MGCVCERFEIIKIQTVILQRRAIRASKNLEAGETINEKNIISLRPCPGNGILPYEKEKILNKKIKKNISKGDIIKWDDII